MTTPRLYGQIARNKDKVWVLQAEPQVTIKYKRVFEKINKAAYGVMLIKDSREACRDIQWMLERYPLEISAYDLRYLRARSAEHRRLEQDVSNIVSTEYKPRDFELALPPREYQRVAADLMLRRDSLLLADDLGVGKSVSAICTLVAPDALPALVVVPKHLQRQWQREINRFAPALSTHIIKTGKPYDLTKVNRRTVPAPDVMICTYGKLVGWADVLAGEIQTVIFDEVQELRHSGTAKYDAAKFVASKAERRMGLSATPVHNYGGEIWTVLNIISPGELGDFDEFTREWCKSEAGYGGTSKAIIKEPKAFGMYLREQGLMLRRTRAEVGRELPPLTKIIQNIDSDTKPIDDVKSAAAELARIILKQGGSGLEKMRAAEELDWRLRQATGIAKAPHVADFVRMLVDNGEPVIVAGWHREVYSIWLERLNDLKPVMYTGSESLNEKERAREAFMNGESQVMIISLRSGAGLDGLQHRCNTIVHGELDWSPACHEQLDGRPHRDGQTMPVTAFYLLADNGSDPVISDALGLKRQQLDGIRDPDAAPVIGATDPNRVKRLAEAFLEQQSQRRESDEEAA